jgi:hypothetical protein
MSTPGSDAESTLIQPAMGLRRQPTLRRQWVLAAGAGAGLAVGKSFTVGLP